MKNNPTLRSAVLATAVLLCAGAHAAGDPQASRYYEDALQRYEKRDMAGAVIQLKNALKLDNRNLSVQVLLGKALLDSGDVVQADVAFTEALRLGVNRVEVVVPLARAVSGQGRPQDMLTSERFALAGLPPRTQYELLLLRAAAATDLGDVRAALKAVDDARAIDAQDTGSWLAEVPVRIRQRQLAEAATAADRAVALAPALADAQYARGEVLHIGGDLRSALAAYDRTLALQPRHAGALVSRAGIALDQGRDADAKADVDALLQAAPSEPRGLYLRALLADRAGNGAAAKAALNQVTALLDPIRIEFLRYRPQTLLLGGMAHHGLHQNEKAKPYLEAVLRGQPQHAVAKVLANIHLADRNFDRAIETLDGYLRGAPGDAQAQLLLASAHMAQGRHMRAAQIMQDALRSGGDKPQLRAALGLSLVGSGRYGDAVKELEAAYAKDPSQLQAGFALGSLYLQSRRPAQAVRVAEALAKAQPSNPGVQNLLGAARAAAGDGAGARAAFEQASRLDPNFVGAQVSLARLDTAAGAHDAALQRLRAVIARDEKNVEAMGALGDVSARFGRLDDAQRWYEKADDHAGLDNLQPALALVDFQLGRGRADAAREALKRAESKKPDAVQTLVAAGRVAIALGDAPAARAVLARAAAAASYNTPLLTQIALLQLQAGSASGAAYTLDKALGERPDDLPAQALRADVDLRQGDFARAEARARQIVAQQPKIGLGHSISGDIALARGQRDAAIDAYRRAHDLDRRGDSALRLFRALSGRDRPAALRLAEQWTKAHPGDVTMRRALADSQLNAGNLAAARTQYEALLQQSPDDAEALNNLANVLLQQKDAGAQKVAEQALAKNPAAPHIIGTAGWAAYKAGNGDRAIQLLRDARLRDPANADTRYFLGAVLASQGRNGEARDELTTALKSARFDNRAAAQSLLQTLR